MHATDMDADTQVQVVVARPLPDAGAADLQWCGVRRDGGADRLVDQCEGATGGLAADLNARDGQQVVQRLAEDFGRAVELDQNRADTGEAEQGFGGRRVRGADIRSPARRDVRRVAPASLKDPMREVDDAFREWTVADGASYVTIARHLLNLEENAHAAPR
ncbi:hypothetical protein [Streptomyces sp. NPDC001502]|uniref:hypothetical protein n=1 Tax=Streptomyces sp. NPDC001502 TaxID=3364578 RepID=UPI003684A642